MAAVGELRQPAAMKPSSFSIALAPALLGLLLAGAQLHGSESDDRIESTFTESYVYRTYLKDDSVKIHSTDGVVVLTGSVAEETHRMLAEQTVASLPGVTRVDNRIVTTAAMAAENTDLWIGRKVTFALLFHRNVDASKTTVVVRDGIVTLTGVAASEAHRDLTTAYAKDIDGVKDVKNQMAVAATSVTEQRTVGERLDDASIVAQVTTSLQTQRSTRASRAKVSARDGEVTITGIAANSAEKVLVSKLVADIRGVTGVKNEMTVEVTAK